MTIASNRAADPVGVLTPVGLEWKATWRRPGDAERSVADPFD